jgi:ubiquinone/menaquinone biosynthesis C-methylase UbiE
MPPVPARHAVEGYALATGEEADYRLRVLHELYGPGTRRVLLDAGIRPGMRVADLGCGVGMVTALLAELVGLDGHVVGVDFSGKQLERARARLAGVTNASFVEASATKTGLARGSFDLVYSRFLLIHLPDPQAALREMRDLLRPGGILVCEDGDLTSAGSEPPSVLTTFSELWGRLGPHRGVDYTLGRRIYEFIREAGFVFPEVTLNQPVRSRGEAKRLLELSVVEAGPAFVAAGLLSASDLQRAHDEMRRVTEDESVLALMPRMTQVWARKSTEG